ncbi:MAG: GNAT family N-acetyltransferase [Candidatus Aminicenantia bacterium]
MSEVEIKKLETINQFKKCLGIQKIAWDFEDLDIVPIPLLILAQKYGGLVLGAFFEEKIVGFVYSFPAVHRGKLIQHSHMLAVLPEYRGKGIGRKLKLAQREWSLNQGYDLITWTFDPLQALNANLNLHTLGVKTKTYLPDFYGPSSSLLHKGLPTDRILAEWWIKENRVKEKIEKKIKLPDFSSYKKALFGKIKSSHFLEVDEINLDLKDKTILVEIPQNINLIKEKNIDLAFSWQETIRKIFIKYFDEGYSAIDFISNDRCFYLLEKE